MEWTASEIDDFANVLFFEGEINEQLIDDLLNQVELYFSEEAISKKTQKRIYHFSVELLQNLLHHATESVVFGVHEEQNMFLLKIRNTIPAVQQLQLEEYLDALNELTEDQLKMLYKERLEKGSFSDKGTAGLGMIELRRKSQNKIGYTFYEFNGKVVFEMSVSVNKQ